MSEDIHEQQDAPEAEAVEVEAEQPIETPEPQPTPKAWSDDDEREARLFGWKAPEEWQGEKPAGYIDNPEEFLGRVQRSRVFQTMQDKLSEQARKLEAMNAKAMERQRSEYESRLAAISQAQRRAVEEADTEAYDRLEQQRQRMMQQPPQDDRGAQDQADEVKQVIARHAETRPWLNDPVLRDDARRAIDVALQSGRAFTSIDEQIEFAEGVLKTRFPHLFQAQEPPKPKQRVEGGGLGSGPARAQGAFDKLPSDVKAVFERQVKQGIWQDTKADREEYAREYDAA